MTTSTEAPDTAQLLAAAQTRLEQAATDAAAAREQLATLKDRLTGGASGVTADDYAAAVSLAEFAELTRVGAETALAGAQEQHRKEQARRQAERQMRGTLRSAQAVVDLEPLARELLKLLEVAVSAPIMTTWQAPAQAARVALLHIVGDGDPRAMSAANLARNEIRGITDQGITLDQADPA